MNASEVKDLFSQIPRTLRLAIWTSSLYKITNLLRDWENNNNNNTNNTKILQ